MMAGQDIRGWGKAAMAAVALAGALGWVSHRAATRPNRFYMPGPHGEVRAAADDWGARQAGDAPGFLTRAIGLRTAEEQAWGHRNGVTPSLSFSHNLERVFPPSLYARHPEFFPLADGRRFQPVKGNYYWNPDLGREDVARYAADQAKAFFDREPGALTFSLGVNDGLLFGESPETLPYVLPPRWFRGRPDYSELVFSFMNRAAAELARSHPDKYLGCLAYYWAENVPPFPVDPHVIPFLTADRSQSYDGAFRAEELALQRRWAAAAGPGDANIPRRLGMYDYLDGQGFLVPRVPIHAFAEHIRRANAEGFTDYYGESSRNWGLDGPLPWVIAQLLQNPRASVEALLAEYYAAYFGPAAGPMRRFFDRCEEIWMEQRGPSYWLKYYRSEAQAVLFPPEVCSELRGYLTDAMTAARAAGAGGAVVAPRVAFAADSFGVTERFVTFQRAREALAVALLNGQVRGDVGRALLADYRGRRSEFIRYTVQLRYREPLAFYPLNWDDWLRNDPGLAAELALRAKDVATADDPPRVTGLSFEGPVVPGRKIAGLPYGIGLPEPWQSKVEPMERHVAELRPGPDGRRVLHLSGNENTTLYQWRPAEPGRVHLASVRARGRISPSDAVMLTVGWLDAEQRPVGRVTVMRLPDGEWNEWVDLRQGGEAPATAAWIGVGLRVQHQMEADWAEFGDFRLEQFPPRENRG